MMENKEKSSKEDEGRNVPRILICDFTGVYEAEGLIDAGDVLDLTDLTGTGMYVDDEAECEIKRRIGALEVSCGRNIGSYGLRFLDNGNYHYMSRILASYVNEPFDLITFDHHTDDQPPAFEGLRSCGSWRLDIARENRFLRQSVLIQSYGDYEAKYTLSGLPVYISIDKDILSTDVVKTNWDQGEMKEEELYDLLEKIGSAARIIAMDICGEDLPENPAKMNRDFNLRFIGSQGVSGDGSR